MPQIILTIEKCRDDGVNCPYSYTERTPRSGFADDYFCKAVNPRRKTSGYVEWSSDVNPVPDWCPFRADRQEILAAAAEKDRLEREKNIGSGI